MPFVFKSVTPEEHKKFTAIRDVEITCADECTLTEMYEAFDCFLKACGYQIPSEEDDDPEEFQLYDINSYQGKIVFPTSEENSDKEEE